MFYIEFVSVRRITFNGLIFKYCINFNCIISFVVRFMPLKLAGGLLTLRLKIVTVYFSYISTLHWLYCFKF